MTKKNFKYEMVERFGESMTKPKLWNTQALSKVELINGRAAMIGFSAAIMGELITGKGVFSQLRYYLLWYLDLGS